MKAFLYLIVKDSVPFDFCNVIFKQNVLFKQVVLTLSSKKMKAGKI